MWGGEQVGRGNLGKTAASAEPRQAGKQGGKDKGKKR